MHYGKIMNEVMIIVKFATSKLGILYSWLCFFKPSNCHHQGLFAFCNRRRHCFRYVSLCIFFQLWMNCIYNVIFVKMKSPNNMLNSVVLFLFGGINKYLAVYFANLYKLKFLFFEKSC